MPQWAGVGEEVRVDVVEVSQLEYIFYRSLVL
jgi:hypothetical protein